MYSSNFQCPSFPYFLFFLVWTLSFLIKLGVFLIVMFNCIVRAPPLRPVLLLLLLSFFLVHLPYLGVLYKGLEGPLKFQSMLELICSFLYNSIKYAWKQVLLVSWSERRYPTWKNTITSHRFCRLLSWLLPIFATSFYAS